VDILAKLLKPLTLKIEEVKEGEGTVRQWQAGMFLWSIICIYMHLYVHVYIHINSRFCETPRFICHHQYLVL
jgi:hypothetical protein